MKRSTKMGTVAAVGMVMLGAVANDTGRSLVRGLPGYIKNSVARTLSDSSREIDKKQIESNEYVDFRTAEHELISKGYAHLCSSQNSVLETGEDDGSGQTYIGHLRARTVTGMQEIVKEMRALSGLEDLSVLITGGCESGKHNKHMERGKSHSAGYKLDIAFSSKMGLNSGGNWLLPWLTSKTGSTPIIGNRYSFSLNNRQKVDVFYESDHLDVRFL